MALPSVWCLATAPLETVYGRFREHYFTDGLCFFAALSLGSLDGKDDLPFRVHSDCISGHVFNGTSCDCRNQMSSSQDHISKIGTGLIVWLPQDGRGNGHAAKLLAEEFKNKGFSQGEAYLKAGFSEDARTYALAAATISYFKINSICLLSKSSRKREELARHGVEIKSTIEV